VVPPSFDAALLAPHPQPPRYRADPVGSRATFSLNDPGGLSAGDPPSLEADGGVLLTVNAVPRV